MRSRFENWRLLGLGFWQAWQIIAMCTDIVAPTSGFLLDRDSALVVLLVLMTLGYLAVVLASRQLAPFIRRRAAYIAASLLMTSGTAAMPLAMMFFVGPAGFALFIFAAACASLGNALLLIMWGELWSALATGRVGRHLYASYTFAFVLFFAIYFLPRLLAVAAAALLPILSTLALYACHREPRREPSVVPLDVRTIPVARLLLCLFVISVIWGLTQGMVVTFAVGDEFFTAKSLLLAGGGIGAITLSMVVSSSPSEALTLYRPVIPAVLVGIILLLLQPAVYPFLGSGLIIMGIYCLDMLIMLVSTDIAFRGRISVALSFGLAILVTRAGTLVGSVSADAFMFAPFWSTQLRTDVCLIAVLLLAVIGMLFFTMADVQQLYVTPRTQKADESLDQKCAAVAAMGNLTKREAEVLLLLARGRSIPYICDELHIAQGTVKHHVSNIYRKLGVYDRQGLLDAIEQGGVGKSALT
ncbi:LuxR C-terminal-related transcriptional regulator [Adlercreutzia sp. R25]|uniref:LuxR C-terminal-related transcriptional regulator n=1 Tax=Adlercreutzia shanghongiae TaxID=3111773 RepID=A0ABU6IWU1_9ACTN|nr:MULTISPECIES: LuxR C-terminal-related transcriptional regulator [unclassified Adlercreutzia]MEC4272449.1 LuxR C-terminal-related transcriptional regulator [Adlercreutzia sp. R25]MEC4294312.1 LuxR C-terminal-related transcriptional regulator [Adlercreutzia sp. R22]